MQQMLWKLVILKQLLVEARKGFLNSGTEKLRQGIVLKRAPCACIYAHRNRIIDRQI